ncbi:MAG: hypothetical protein H8E84_01530 [Flavobacteriales bacterium]|nr:hypothetical protein [Flavobacteriales bacterium]
MKRIIIALLGISLVFTSCKKGKVEISGCTDSSALNFDPLATIDDSSCIYPVNTSLTINFSQTVDGVDLTTDTMIYTNSAGEDYSIQTLKYLISDITLHKDDSTSILLKEVHFVDIRNASTLSVDFGELQDGNYTSISFTMGLDTAKNISNRYVNEDFHATMFWPEPNGGGYHYMKLEGAYTNDSTFYNTHTGGTMGGDYSFNNNSSILLNVNNDMGDVIIDINMEINNWYQTPNEIAFSTYGMGIMMNMQKQMELKQNGMTDIFSVSVNQ